MLDFLDSRFEYFLRCAECASFNEAAARIGISQAALSQAMQALEARLGARLFDRGRKGSRLTAEGKALLETLRRGKQELSERMLSALRQPADVPLKIGAVVHYGLYRLVPALEKHAAKLPRSQVFFTYSLHSYEAVRAGKLDFAFVSWTNRPKDLVCIPVQRDRGAIVGLRSRFSHISKAESRRALKDEPWVVQEKPQFDWTEALPADQGGYVVRDQHAYKQLILSGRAIGDVQLDMFTPEERKRLVISRVPPTYDKAYIYAIHRDDISSRARAHLEYLVSLLREK